jgi:hypothetical protein
MMLSGFVYYDYKLSPGPYAPSICLKNEGSLARDELRYPRIIKTLMYILGSDNKA